MLTKPKAIYRSETRPESVVVFTYEINAGCPIVIPVSPSSPTGRGPRTNLILSMYGKDGPRPAAGVGGRGTVALEEYPPQKQRSRLARHFVSHCLVWDARRDLQILCRIHSGLASSSSL